MRWKATITYKNSGNLLVHFDEIEELHEIVERGPCFYDIQNINVEPGERDAKVCVRCAPANDDCTVRMRRGWSGQ